MLKKVMIICLALSFVFIGGIGFALAGDCDGTQKRNKDRLKDSSCLPFTNSDSSIIIAKDQIRDRLQDGSCQIPFINPDSSIIIAAQDGAQNGHGPGPAPNSGDGISDGPGWPEWDFISHDSTIILAADQTRDRDRDRDRARDGSCLDS